jgi:hypothetical protein
LARSLGISCCINCNVYGYNSKRFLRIFLTVDCGTGSSRLALDTDVLGLRTKLARTLLTVSSVKLGLPAWSSPWWQMHPLSRNCPDRLRIDDTGGPRCPHCRRNTHWTATTLLLLAHSSTHELGSHFSNNDIVTCLVECRRC